MVDLFGVIPYNIHTKRATGVSKMTQEDREYYAACKAYEKLELRQNDERLGSAVEYVIGKMAYEQYLEDQGYAMDDSYSAYEIADYEWSRYNA